MLFVSLARVRGALPVNSVLEVMRPLPVTPLGRAPAWCLGMSIIRGAVVPVVDLASLLWGEADGAARRLVTLELGTPEARRTLALRVRDVLGLGRLPMSSALPSLLGAAEAVHGANLSNDEPSASASRAAATSLDQALTLALEPARLLSDEAWAELLLAQGADR